MGLVILVMIVLVRLFPAKGPAGEDASLIDETGPDTLDEPALEEMAVALAVGICLLERDGALQYKDPSLGKLLEE
jgi:hypothetical protein